MNNRNKLTEGANLIWEGSRMILPEHKEAINERLRNQSRIKKPSLHNDELLKISSSLSESLYSGKIITLTVYEEQQEYVAVSGYVVSIDQLQRRILFRHSQGKNWISFDDIVRAVE